MSEAKHTPAPWTIQDYGDNECPTLVLHRGETENRICFMATPGSRGDPAMIEADARLIAAAPDLLEALARLMERYVALVGSGDCGFWNPDEEAEVIAARAAIAKATGAAP